MNTYDAALLMVVDTQNSFINDHTRHVLRPINELINYWRNQKGSIVFSRFINPEGGPWEKLRSWRECKTEPEILLHSELDKGKDMVVDKHTYSAWGDDVVQLCVSRRLDTVVLCGIDTNECVLATAIDVFDHGFRPVIIRDACASAAGERFHEAALVLLERLLGSEQIIAGSAIMR